MKRTPEQEAYYQYGKSVARLIWAWKFVREFPTPSYLKSVRYTDSYIPDTTYKEFVSFMYYLEDARQKRSVCRRTCLKCTHCHSGTCTICDVYDPQYLDPKRAIDCKEFVPRKEDK